MAKVQRGGSVAGLSKAVSIAAENEMLRAALRRIASGQRPARGRRGIRTMNGPEMQREAQQTLVSIGVTRWSE